MTRDEQQRRAFLAATGKYLSLTFASRALSFSAPRLTKDPFTLGVASGDPWPDGVLLWTRLAPEPLAGGGMPGEDVEVDWIVAADEQLKRVVKRGRTVARPEHAHSVHAEVRGLEPARWYWYQFRVGSHVSPVGRTRT
ncbi:MAG TPA: PhoD-like phosphatase N-terminal domain-containing protein, partial [Bryobacteraceae bacterium]|nr:PhoD-like phosphatase N-terminal domain-containing protein [Bryobacteraceae bacterium]